MLEVQNKNTYFNAWISKIKGRRRMARNLKKNLPAGKNKVRKYEQQVRLQGPQP